MTNNSKKYAVMWASTSNIGDDIQTIAAIKLLNKTGHTVTQFIDREKLSTYSGPHVHLIMNGWFMHNIDEFPPCKNITPVFVSFHCAKSSLIDQNLQYFKTYEPIGCRDTRTQKLFEDRGIKAYFTGCLTLTLDTVKEKGDAIYLVNCNKETFPEIESSGILNSNSKWFGHGVPGARQDDVTFRLTRAQQLLDLYSHANLVITTKLHCLLPCRALGTDAIFVHKRYKSNARFAGLKDVICGDDVFRKDAKRYVNIDPVKDKIFKQFSKAINISN